MMNVTEETQEEIRSVVEHHHQLMDQLPLGHADERRVPQIVVTVRELMILVAHYKDKCHERKATGLDGANSDDAALDELYGWRGSGILCVLTLLFGDDEVDRLKRVYLSSVRAK